MNDRTLHPDNHDAFSMDERLLDRLVDGSLELSVQRELLNQLDRTPDGWRRCALAFLEAQAWRSELRQIQGQVDRFARKTDSPTHLPLIVNRPLSASRATARLVGTALALFVAFGLGWISRPVASGPQNAVAHAPDKAPFSQPADSAEQIATNEEPPLTPSETHETEWEDDVHVAARLSWELDREGEKRNVEVPVLEGRGLDMEWVMQQPTAVQEPIRKALERRGHKVETQRQLLTVNLKDGRSVVVPIEQVQVKFAKRLFQ